MDLVVGKFAGRSAPANFRYLSLARTIIEYQKISVVHVYVVKGTKYVVNGHFLKLVINSAFHSRQNNDRSRL